MNQDFIEKLIIKGILTDKRYMTLVTGVFVKEYFDDPTVSEAFRIIQKHFQEYNTIPEHSLIVNTEAKVSQEDIRDLLEEVDGINFNIARNFEALFENTNIFLKDKAVKRGILDSVDVIEAGKDVIEIRQIIEDALCKDLKIDLGLNYFGQLADRLKRILTCGQIRIPTYYPQFDEFINGGFPPFTFSVIVAKIHGFKSNTLVNFATRQILNSHNVVLASMEMSQDAFAQRFDSIFTCLDINRIYSIRSKTKELMKGLKEIKQYPQRGELFIKDFPTGEGTVQDIRMYLRELIIRDIKPSIVYVDYINLMKPSSNANDTMLYSKVKRIAEELRALSFEFEIPVVSVSQLNREGGFATFNEVDFEFISESMGVPATADFMSIYGIDEDKMVYESELFYKICKNRLGGRVGEIGKFYYDTRSLKMYDSLELDLWLEEATISGDDRKIREG